ncbi:MAG: membrane protein insertase YidC, partial [Pseudomonadota bacterium]|nr:membrane protein insertase YidC [Pseudomonadota bacterium]
MLPAEIQRIVLLIGLAATGYLLILAWNEDAQEARTTDYYSAEPEIAGIESARSAIPTERSQPTDAVNDDIPAMPLPSNDVQPQSAITEPYSADRLITVTTPSIKMWIDLEGGDVVRVLLPKFPVQIDDPDIPFVLLDQGQQRIYVAQSGLIGADGTDSNGERP